jgi:general secretion pathway protein A
VYALNEKNGFVQLTGEVGVGKTMACRYILANIPGDIDVALILNPRIGEIGLLRTLCQELQISFDSSQLTNELTQLIYRKLLDTHAKGHHTILIIDEAQNLPKRTLEQIRLLTNLETATQKLLRIILIGQPELGQLLASHDMRQVAQRITSRYHLGSLEVDETDEYILHRLRIAGCERRLFTKSATRKIYRLTDGIPRLINLLCDRALIGAYSLGEHEVSPDIVKTAAKEALPFVEAASSNSSWARWLPAVAIGFLFVALAATYKDQWQGWISQNWPQPTAASPAAESVSNPAAKVEAQIDNKDLRIADSFVEKPLIEKPLIENSADASIIKAEIPPSIPEEKFEQFGREADVGFRLNIPAQNQSLPDAKVLRKSKTELQN